MHQKDYRLQKDVNVNDKKILIHLNITIVYYSTWQKKTQKLKKSIISIISNKYNEYYFLSI